MKQNESGASASDKSSSIAASSKRPYLAIIIVTAWAIFQIPRLMAISLIQSILAGNDSAIWLFPAIGDIVIGTTAPFIAFVVWRKTGLWAWVASLIWLSISIFDHTSTTTAFLTSTPPQIFKEFGDSGVFVPLGQAVIDASLFVLMAGKRMSAYFLGDVLKNR